MCVSCSEIMGRVSLGVGPLGGGPSVFIIGVAVRLVDYHGFV